MAKTALTHTMAESCSSGGAVMDPGKTPVVRFALGTSVSKFESRDWVIAFIRENARKSPSEIEAVIQEGQRELVAALDGVSEEQAAYKPGADDWSILELLAHVASVKQVIGTLVGTLRNGELPPGIGPHFEEEGAGRPHDHAFRHARPGVRSCSSFARYPRHVCPQHR